jgi:hypothetical protein
VATKRSGEKAESSACLRRQECVYSAPLAPSAFTSHSSWQLLLFVSGLPSQKREGESLLVAPSLTGEMIGDEELRGAVAPCGCVFTIPRLKPTPRKSAREMTECAPHDGVELHALDERAHHERRCDDSECHLEQNPQRLRDGAVERGHGDTLQERLVEPTHHGRQPLGALYHPHRGEAAAPTRRPLASAPALLLPPASVRGRRPAPCLQLLARSAPMLARQPTAYTALRCVGLASCTWRGVGDAPWLGRQSTGTHGTG